MFKILIFFKNLNFKNFYLKFLKNDKINLCELLLKKIINIKNACGGFGKCSTCLVFINESSNKKYNKSYKPSCLINFFYNIIITV